jgi:hypothetical protein
LPSQLSFSHRIRQHGSPLYVATGSIATLRASPSELLDHAFHLGRVVNFCAANGFTDNNGAAVSTALA